MNPTQKTRDRILAAAAKLLARGGQDAPSTRAVSATAGVQAPISYRLFGDKQGLHDAVAVDALETYADDEVAPIARTGPRRGLRAGWDEHVAFGLAHPEVYALLRRQRRDGEPPPASLAAAAVLQGHIHRIALAVGFASPSTSPSSSSTI